MIMDVPVHCVIYNKSLLGGLWALLVISSVFECARCFGPTSWRMRPSAARQRRFAPGEVSLRLPSTQGRGLAMLVLDARANPHYPRVQPKSHSSLSLSIMWDQVRTIPTLDPSAKSPYPHLCFTFLHFTARPLIYKHISQFNYTSKRCSIIALCYIILLFLSIYISFHL